MKDRILTFLKRFPLVPLVGLVVLLKSAGEFYPLSPFPMYSNPSAHAQVLRVTTDQGEMIPTLRVFGERESNCKKMFVNELKKLCKVRGVSRDEASAAEIEAAGAKILERIYARRKEGALDAFPTEALQLHLIDLLMESDEVTRTEKLIYTKKL